MRRNSCCRSSSLFLKYSSFFLSMDDDSAAGPLPESFLSLSRTKMICAQIEMRQLPQRTHGVTGKQLSPKEQCASTAPIIAAVFPEGWPARNPSPPSLPHFPATLV